MATKLNPLISRPGNLAVVTPMGANNGLTGAMAGYANISGKVGGVSVAGNPVTGQYTGLEKAALSPVRPVVGTYAGPFATDLFELNPFTAAMPTFSLP